MSEQGTSVPVSQGSIRQAREAMGLSLEALAGTLKVSPAKLEALESGRFSELPDLAFTRALAKTVCRHLGMDPAGVLAGLPSAQPVDLSASDQKGVPFKASKARLNLDAAGALPWADVLKAKWLLPIGILLAALALHFWPQETPWLDAQLKSLTEASTPASAASLAPALPDDLAARNARAAEVASSQPAEPLVSVAPSSAQPASAASVPAQAPSVPQVDTPAKSPLAVASGAEVANPSSAGLQLVMSDSSWVEVRSQLTGDKVLYRQLNAGETVNLDATPPLSVKIGNAAAVKLNFRGQPIELDAFTRNNVARLELK